MAAPQGIMSLLKKSERVCCMNNKNKYVGNMKFDVACVRDFLAKNGFVFTVRSYDLEDADVTVEGIGVCSRKKLINIESGVDLIPFVHGSGFDVVEAWFEKICSYGAQKGVLYLVEKKKN